MIGGLRRPRREFARALIMAEGITAVRRIQKFQAGGGADVAPSGQESNLSRSLRFKERLETEILENAQRLASEQMFDNELGIGLRNQIGPYRSEAIDPSRYSMLATPASASGTRGLYARPNVSASEEQLIAFDEPYREVLDQENMKHFGQDMVYTFGAPQANLQILGHEFGHRGDFTQGLYPPTGAREAVLTHLSSIPPREQYQESFNLLFDAWRARTPEQWENAVGTWGYTQNRFFQETGGEQGRDYSAGSSGWTQEMVNRASADLAQLLDLNRENLLILEADAMEKQHRARQATLDERGLPYTPETPEKTAEFRARNLENLSNAADSRAVVRRPSTRRAYGGGVYG